MDEVHKRVLKKNRITLANDLVIDEVLQYLVEKEILSDHLVEKISSKATNFDKNVELLTLLPKRGPYAFDQFLSSLNETDQGHLAENLMSFDARNDKNHLSSMDSNGKYANAPDVSSFSFLSPSTGIAKEKQFSATQKRLLVSPESLNTSANETKTSETILSKKQCFDPHYKSQDGKDVIPSPCDELHDLLSNESTESLLIASHLKTPNTCKKQKEPSNLIEDQNTSDSKFISNCDLADGPTYNDLIVRRGTIMHQSLDSYDSYEISSNPRGLALIVSVDHFEPSACLENRQAADVDRARLEFVLRQLGFKCFKFVDGTAREIWDVLKKFVALEEHHHCDVAMLVVMSHGEEGCFFGRDGQPVEIEQIVRLFNNKHCKGLHNKPKVVLFQCCRGNTIDKGVDESDGRLSASQVAAPEADMSTSSSSLDSLVTYNKLPTQSDCLVGYATVKGFAAMRNTKHGSWYIQALVRVLAFHACDKHLVEIMTIVNNLIKYREGNSPATEYHRCKEMSIFHSTLCKKLYLFPGS